MKKTIEQIINKSNKKLKQLDIEKILCFTIDSNKKIISGRNISKNNEIGRAYINLGTFYRLINNEMVTDIIIVHNHPQNTIKPSEDDKHFTLVLNRVCKEHNINLYDHIIIMKDSKFVYSFRDNNNIIKR